MNTLSDTDGGRARPAGWPMYVATVVGLIVCILSMHMLPTWHSMISITQETGEPLPAVFFLGLGGTLVVGFAAFAFLAWALVSRSRLSFPPKQAGEE